MDILFSSPSFVPYCILILAVWEENYCNYVEQENMCTPLLYYQSWYATAIILCNIITFVAMFVLCFTSTWWFLAFSIFSVLIWLPLSGRLITRTLGVIIARPLAAIVEILLSIYFVINWF